METIRKPKQERAKQKFDKIVASGFELITKKGYNNINTKEIAKYAGVSTGIVYQYFSDKHDILMSGLNKYGDEIFFPMLNKKNDNIKFTNFNDLLNTMIDNYIKNHKISKIAHEELMALVHLDKDVAKYYYERELKLTTIVKNILENNNFKDDNLEEKVHITIHLIDDLCHEIIYHKHNDMNYDKMKELTINTILKLLNQNKNSD